MERIPGMEEFQANPSELVPSASDTLKLPRLTPLLFWGDRRVDADSMKVDGCISKVIWLWLVSNRIDALNPNGRRRNIVTLERFTDDAALQIHLPRL